MSDEWNGPMIPDAPVPRPVGPVAAKLLECVDEGLLPTFDVPNYLKSEARVLALAAVVDSPWNQTVARAAARMFAAGDSRGATADSIRRRVELLLSTPVLHAWGREQDHLDALAAALDLVAAVRMSDERTVDGEPLGPSMGNTGNAVAELVDEMGRMLDFDDYRAQIAGSAKGAIRKAAFEHRDFIEAQVEAWAPAEYLRQ
jgi:hypothetical protein